MTGVLPTNVWFWIVLVVAVAGLIGLAVFKGRGLVLRYGSGEARVDAADTRSTTTVAKRLEAENAEFGNVIGTRGAAPGAGRDVDVLSDAKFKRVKTGDIIGSDESEPSTTK